MTALASVQVGTGYGMAPLATMVRHYWRVRHSDLSFYRRRVRAIIVQAREVADAA